MTVFDPNAQGQFHQRLRALVEQIIEAPPPALAELATGQPHEVVTGLLKSCQQAGDEAAHTRLLVHFGATLQQSIPLGQLDRSLTHTLAQPGLSNTQRVHLASLHARLLTQRGDLERAHHVLDHAWPAADTPLLQAALHNRLAVLLEVEEFFPESHTAYQRALALARAAEAPLLVASVLNNLGHWAYAQDRYVEALPYFAEAVQVATPLGAWGLVAAAEGGMAMTLTDLARYDEAEQYHQAAQHHYELEHDRAGLLRTTLNRCYLALERHDYSTARALANHALLEAQQLGDLQREAAALHHLGQSYLEVGEYELAAANLLRALERRRWLGKQRFIEMTEALIERLILLIEATSEGGVPSRCELLQRLWNARARGAASAPLPAQAPEAR